MELLERRFAGQQVIAIIRGQSEASTIELAEHAWAAGIEIVEVTVETPAGVASVGTLAAIADAGGFALGAGTVLSQADATNAISAGAAFLVSPGFSNEVATIAESKGTPYLPGVGTATEITNAMSRGYSWLKAFPVAALGPAWISAMLGPFPDAKFIGTGGVNIGNSESFFNAGCVGVGISIRTQGDIDLLARRSNRSERRSL